MSHRGRATPMDTSASCASTGNQSYPRAVGTCAMCRLPCPVPVLMVNCGHRFCLRCLENFWQSLATLERTCPTCTMQGTQRHSVPQPASCDMCPAHAPCVARWSCLNCGESYCSEHFQPHIEGEGDRDFSEHQVCDADGEEACRMREVMGGSRRCPEHRERMVELYCKVCKVCICTLCPLLGSHQTHPVTLIQEEARMKKNLTDRCLERLDEKNRHVLSNIEHIDLAATELKARTLASTESLTGKFTELRLLLDEEEKLARKYIEEKTKLALWAYDAQIESCREHITTIDTFSSHVKSIQQQHDAVKMIREYTSAEKDMQRHMSPAEQLHPVPVTYEHIENYFSSFTEAFKASLKEPLANRLKSNVFSSLSVTSSQNPGTLIKTKSFEDRSLFLKHARCPTLDPDTMHPKLRLLEDRLTIYTAWIGRFNSGHPQRFDKLLQVMSRDCFYSGSHYWEVDLLQAGQGWWIGITYPSIQRKGDTEFSRLGWNSGSWCIKRYAHEHWAFYKGERTPIMLEVPPERVGVFLDYEAGVLSFFDVTNGMRLLHTFRCRFTEPVYPALRLWDGKISICRLN
ncbi:tripartite motif-containing protein 14 [Xenopus laevis]|uniref:Tripartite motif-containing protein 14 n=1 Tax=Xenopus laevis TaxID=8355 RepID=A0A8J0U5P6_XENLA|nr:tripartite motif-containing protein 14 [Xenopus laevis]OCT59263.1 hypothetical protein XELAEV_18001215mg [Xenopus laevis]